MLSLHAVTGEDGHPCEDEDESCMRLCTYWSKVFESRNEDERHHAHETILENVQKVPDDIQWEIGKREFDEKIDTKKESAPGPDGIPYGIYRCAGGFGPTSCSMPINVCLMVAPFPHILVQAGPFSFGNLPLSTTVVLP